MFAYKAVKIRTLCIDSVLFSGLDAKTLSFLIIKGFICKVSCGSLGRVQPTAGAATVAHEWNA